MTYVWDAKRGQPVPILVVIRETVAAETNTRTVLQRQGLADQLKIQHLCIRFANLFNSTIRKQNNIAWNQWLNVTTTSLIALEAKFRYENSVQEEFARLHDIILKEKDELFEVETRALISFKSADGVVGLGSKYNNDGNKFMKRMVFSEHRPKDAFSRLVKMESLPQYTFPKSRRQSFNPCFTQRRHISRSLETTIGFCYHVGTKSRFKYQREQVWEKNARDKLHFLRIIQPQQEEAALILQRIGRGSVDRSQLRGPMMIIFQTRALKVIVRFLRRCVKINFAKREALKLKVAKEWNRAASLSIDRGLLLRIFTDVLQKFTYYAISTRLRAALHVVFRIEADARKKRFFVTAAAMLRKMVRERKLREKIAERNKLELRQYSALKIQRQVRSFLTRRRVQRNEISNKANLYAERDRKELENYSACLIQSAFRQKLLAKNKAFTKLKKMKEMKIRLKEYNERRNYAAVVIARSWRAHHYSQLAEKEKIRQTQQKRVAEMERLHRLSQPFNKDTYNGSNNPFFDRYQTVEREIAERNRKQDDEPPIADFSNFAFSMRGGKHVRAVDFTSRRDPVVPSAFAYLRGLPHAAAATAAQHPMTPEEEERLKEIRRQRRRNIVAHNAKCKNNLKKLVKDPLGMNSRTRSILNNSMGFESTLPKIDDTDEKEKENDSQQQEHNHTSISTNDHQPKRINSSRSQHHHFSISDLKKQIHIQKQQNISKETRVEAWGKDTAVDPAEAAAKRDDEENQQPQPQRPTAVTVSSKFVMDMKRMQQEQKRKKQQEEEEKKLKEMHEEFYQDRKLLEKANLYKF